MLKVLKFNNKRYLKNLKVIVTLGKVAFDTQAQNHLRDWSVGYEAASCKREFSNARLHHPRLFPWFPKQLPAVGVLAVVVEGR